MKIIKSACVFILLLFSAIVSRAQEDYASVTLRIRNPKDALGISGNSGNLAYIFEGHKQYHVSILNSSRQESANIIVNRITRGKKEKLIGAVLTESKYIAYFYSKKYHSFSSLVVDIPTGNYKFHELKQMAPEEQFLRAFTMNEKFYVLTVPKQKNILNIYESEDGEKANAGTYGIELTTFYSSLSSNNDLLNEAAESAVGIETIRSRLDNNIKSAYPKKKLYYENGLIYMTFDEPSATNMIIIDLAASKSYYKKLNFALEQGNNSSDKRGNSFLYDNKIFRATISQDMMNISIIDLDSITLINSFNIFPDETISIANGPVVQEGGANGFTGEERVLNKTNQYFNRVLNGNISIAANRIDSGRVEMEVGSYEEIVVRSNNGGFANPGFSMGMGMGMGMGFGMGGFGMGGFGMGSPYGFGNPFGYGYPGAFGGGGNSVRLRIVSFKSLLKDPVYNHVNGNLPRTLSNKINQYMEQRFKNSAPDLYTITSYNEEKLLIGYYSKSKNKFDIVQFYRIDHVND